MNNFYDAFLSSVLIHYVDYKYSPFAFDGRKKSCNQRENTSLKWHEGNTFYLYVTDEQKQRKFKNPSLTELRKRYGGGAHFVPSSGGGGFGRGLRLGLHPHSHSHVPL